MVLNKQKGNMYPWVSHTWNPIKGKCPHNCSYCYMKRFKVGKLRLDDKALKDNLGKGNTIFVGSSIDVFADRIPEMWIMSVLHKCCLNPKNKYLFQTKNPYRMNFFTPFFPPNSILGTTIETDRPYTLYNTPNRYQRIAWIKKLRKEGWEVMVSIEPIYDFNLKRFVCLIKEIKPTFVSIGADSQGHNLPEPSKEKTLALIEELRKFTEVKVKPNLKRIIT